MTVHSQEAAAVVIGGLNASVKRQVVHRARQLCIQAEPHTDDVPCATHLNEANRQLFHLAPLASRGPRLG